MRKIFCDCCDTQITQKNAPHTLAPAGAHIEKEGTRIANIAISVERFGGVDVCVDCVIEALHALEVGRARTGAVP